MRQIGPTVNPQACLGDEHTYARAGFFDPTRPLAPELQNRR